MVKRYARRRVDRSQHRRYLDVAEHFYEAARASIDLEYWTAAGVLIVHAAIAFSDSLSIMLAGEKSAGENHEDAIVLLDRVVAGDDEKTQAINQIRRIIEEKTKVSYLGALYGPTEIREMWKRLERFRRWALGILER